MNSRSSKSTYLDLGPSRRESGNSSARLRTNVDHYAQHSSQTKENIAKCEASMQERIAAEKRGE